MRRIASFMYSSGILLLLVYALGADSMYIIDFLKSILLPLFMCVVGFALEKKYT